MKVIIAAAGTAGHINPGLSIANTIKKNDPTAQIIFVGTKRGLENDLVPRAGYELKTIEAYGITLSNTTKAFKILKGYKQAKSIIKEFKPDIVIGTGGYICGPVLTEASKMNIPTMLHESNAFPGKAVKFLAKHTNTILVAFEDAKNRIEGAKKIVVTGTPTKINKLNLTETERNNIIKNVGLNHTRSGIIDVVSRMGGNIEILNKTTVSGEEVGDIRVQYTENLKPCVIEGEDIPRLIDELPVIAVLASQADGETIIKDAEDLRNKEADRIKCLVKELSKIGVDIEEHQDGFIVHGKTKLKGNAELESYHDHRLAMSYYIAGLICENEITINGFEWTKISFPEFEELVGVLI